MAGETERGCAGVGGGWDGKESRGAQRRCGVGCDGGDGWGGMEGAHEWWGGYMHIARAGGLRAMPNEAMRLQARTWAGGANARRALQLLRTWCRAWRAGKKHAKPESFAVCDYTAGLSQCQWEFRSGGGGVCLCESRAHFKLRERDFRRATMDMCCACLTSPCGDTSEALPAIESGFRSHSGRHETCFVRRCMLRSEATVAVLDESARRPTFGPQKVVQEYLVRPRVASRMAYVTIQSGEEAVCSTVAALYRSRGSNSGARQSLCARPTTLRPWGRCKLATRLQSCTGPFRKACLNTSCLLHVWPWRADDSLTCCRSAQENLCVCESQKCRARFRQRMSDVQARPPLRIRFPVCARSSRSAQRRPSPVGFA
ncbi:hypothetical protein L1887_53080 [Cichorium endivia]|nr:hypothetical protein L1887_53080 [Cichorium endivia]